MSIQFFNCWQTILGGGGTGININIKADQRGAWSTEDVYLK